MLGVPAKHDARLRFYAGHVDLVTPDSGPTGGGTLVRIYGIHLHGGKPLPNRRCRFESGGPSTPASLDGSSGALLCFSPPSLGGVAATHQLQVALNGEHFTSDQPAFSYYHPPALSDVSPAAGFSNGTVVTVSGYGVWRQGALCRFGAALVNATRHLSADSVKCAAPPAALSGAWSRVALTFSEPWSSSLYGFEASLRGIARVHNGTLRLVDKHEEGSSPVGSSDWNAVGSMASRCRSWRCRPSAQGHLPAADGRRRRRRRHQLLLRRLGRNIGELGSGNGLRVCFRTLSLQRIEIWYASSLLRTSSPPAGHSLRADAFTDVFISTAPQVSVGHRAPRRQPRHSRLGARGRMALRHWRARRSDQRRPPH